MATTPTLARSGRTIVFAVPDFEPAVGGTSRQVGLQARELRRRGYDVVVVTRCFERGWKRFEILNGLPVHRIGRPSRGLLADRHGLVMLAAWLRRRRGHIGVVHTVMWPNAPLAAAVAGVLDRTVVVWAIMGEIADALSPRGHQRRPLTLVRRRILARCTHVVLTSAMKEEFVALSGRTDVATIPVPVDLAEFRPPTTEERAGARADLGLREGDFVVVYVGHLVVRKGVGQLIDAVSTLRDEGRDVVLLLVGSARGSDNTEKQLRRRVAADGLGEVVQFLGAQPDPRPYLWAADAFALASTREGMPNSILEAMACGLPSVAPPSAAGDQLLTAQTGIVPHSNDPDELRAALATLADDRKEAAAMGRAARAAVAPFAVERVVDRYEQLFRTLA